MGLIPLTFRIVFPLTQEIVLLIFLATITLVTGVGEGEAEAEGVGEGAGVAAACVILIPIFGDEKWKPEVMMR